MVAAQVADAWAVGVGLRDGGDVDAGADELTLADESVGPVFIPHDAATRATIKQAGSA